MVLLERDLPHRYERKSPWKPFVKMILKHSM